MLSTICAEIKNYFTYDGDKHFGDFAIVGGVVTPSLTFTTDYFRIIGSHKNDGVHKITDELEDEGEFHGAIWIMSPPKDFIDLAAEIEAWQAKYCDVDSTLMSPFQSESFGGYSYSKASGGSSSGESSVPTWKSIFASRLNIYRKIRVN